MSTFEYENHGRPSLHPTLDAAIDRLAEFNAADYPAGLDEVELRARIGHLLAVLTAIRELEEADPARTVGDIGAAELEEEVDLLGDELIAADMSMFPVYVDVYCALGDERRAATLWRAGCWLVMDRRAQEALEA
jgi:hypothetical protein